MISAAARELTDRGYDLYLGRHPFPYRGYHARFFRYEDMIPPDDWNEYGHGLTMEEAVENAVAVHNGIRPLSAEHFTPLRVGTIH